MRSCSSVGHRYSSQSLRKAIGRELLQTESNSLEAKRAACPHCLAPLPLGELRSKYCWTAIRQAIYGEKKPLLKWVRARLKPPPRKARCLFLAHDAHSIKDKCARATNHIRLPTIWCATLLQTNTTNNFHAPRPAALLGTGLGGGISSC